MRSLPIPDTAPTPLLAELRRAYVAAGSPELAALAIKAGVDPKTLRKRIKGSETARELEALDKIAAALGKRITLSDA